MTELVPVEGVSITSSGSKRTLTVTPSANASGETVITITVSDGAKQASAAFTVTVNAVADSPILSVARAVDGGLAVEWSGGGGVAVQLRPEKLVDCGERSQPVRDRSRRSPKIFQGDSGIALGLFRNRVGVHPFAGADRVPVAVDVVDAVNRRPILVLP